MEKGKQGAAYIELYGGKIKREDVLKKAVELGMDELEAKAKLDSLLLSKGKLAKRLRNWGILAMILGFGVSIIASSSSTYEYFYWWGMIFLGGVLFLTGVVLNRQRKR